jgi:hypothetical protein
LPFGEEEGIAAFLFKSIARSNKWWLRQMPEGFFRRSALNLIRVVNCPHFASMKTIWEWDPVLRKSGRSTSLLRNYRHAANGRCLDVSITLSKWEWSSLSFFW